MAMRPYENTHHISQSLPVFFLQGDAAVDDGAASGVI
jgi:hypothetical protein